MSRRGRTSSAPAAGRLLLLLILAGEAAYTLPFHVARFFRPSLLASFQLTNADWGLLQSAYGLTALLSYFPGGLIADRLPARTLLSSSLALTAVGGLYYATLPDFRGLLVLHLYWGVTTTFLFWGALIRATRDSHPAVAQGRAFGLLEGGRGLLAALVASVGLALLSQGPLDGPQRDLRLRQIILLYSLVTGCMAVACHFGLRELRQELTDSSHRTNSSLSHAAVPKGPSAASHIDWRSGLVHGALIVIAYCGFRGVDLYSTYATEVLAMDEVGGAALATWSVWLRAPAAITAGLLADRLSASRVTLASFSGLALGFGMLAWRAPLAPLVVLAVVLLLSTSALLYGMRGLYFALLQERRVPEQTTGTFVGFISAIGFTPDFFFPALAGFLIDSAPTPGAGYARFFWLLCALSGAGALLVSRSGKPPAQQFTPAPPSPRPRH